jgi:RNA polymerase sigma factor (sigma-70 family)
MHLLEEGVSGRPWRGAISLDSQGEKMNSAEQTVISFLPLARWMAARQIRRGWTQNDYDDFVSCAIMAAQKACERCALPQCVRDTDGGARCPYTFARMSGAILDFMREADPMTRGGRREVKEGKRPPVTLVPIDACTSTHEPNYAARLDAQKALDSLSPRERTIVEMYAQGYVISEIANRFRLSQGRISQLYGTALVQMRKRLRTRMTRNV